MTIDEAIKHCKEEAEKYMEYGIETECYQCGKDHEQLAEWLTELKELKAADVQPVKHGRWSYYKNNGIYYQFKCTNCNVKIEITISELTRDDMPDGWNFCPHCGARMDGDAE